MQCASYRIFIRRHRSYRALYGFVHEQIRVYRRLRCARRARNKCQNATYFQPFYIEANTVSSCPTPKPGPPPERVTSLFATVRPSRLASFCQLLVASSKKAESYWVPGGNVASWNGEARDRRQKRSVCEGRRRC